MLILHRFLINHSRSVITTGKYLSILRFDSGLANQMKRLKEENKFDRVLQLYDTYNKDNHPKSLPSRIVTEALKACTKINDLQRAKYIHHRLSSSNQSDPYIVSSLIDFYSTFNYFLSINICRIRCISSAICRCSNC